MKNCSSLYVPIGDMCVRSERERERERVSEREIDREREYVPVN